MQEQQDGAVEAFNDLRDVVGGLSLQMDRMQQALADAPDYAETFSAMFATMKADADQLSKVAASPALAFDPRALSADMKAMNERVGQVHRAVVQDGGGKLLLLRQHSRLLMGCCALGAVILSGLGICVIKFAPEKWLLPEMTAVWLVEGSAWEAGEELMKMGSPNGWNRLVADHSLLNANEEKLAACRKASARSGKMVRCIIDVPPAAKAGAS